MPKIVSEPRKGALRAKNLRRLARFARRDVKRPHRFTQFNHGPSQRREGRQIIGLLTVAENPQLGGFFRDPRTLLQRRQACWSWFPKSPIGLMHPPGC
jgi:ABC-type branched-subunit amino acid transport system ATPase component